MKAICCLLSLIPLIQPAQSDDYVDTIGLCGFPGKPQHGEVYVFYRHDKQYANYYCDRSEIEGSTRRNCDTNGQWTDAVPRCASDVSHTSTVSCEGEPPVEGIRRVRDKNWTTCPKFANRHALGFRLPKRLHIAEVNVTFEHILPNLNEWAFNVTIGDSETGAKGDGGRASPIADPSKRTMLWKLYDIGDVVTINLLASRSNKAPIRICEVQINAYSDDCGPPEVPSGCQVQWADKEATYLCHSNCQAKKWTRKCIEGRWDGQPPICFRSKANLEAHLSQTMIVSQIVLFGGWAFAAFFIITTVVLAVLLRKNTRNSTADAVEHVYEEIRDNPAATTRPIPEGFQGYEIPNHLL